MSERYLVSIAIGPVQEFIATARRSRDLWFGSWLLSELSKAAALKIAQLNGNESKSLIFPAPDKIDDLHHISELGVANKILGKITGNLKETLQAVEQAVMDRLISLSNEAYSHLNASNFDFDIDTAREQMLDLLEFYWAAVEVAEEPNGTIKDYASARSRVEALLAARKVTRAFSQPDWGSGLPKSSLDGQRESVIPESRYPHPNENQASREDKAEKLWKLYGVRVGERLCGVGLVKRHGQRREEPVFFSTSHVAALPLMERFRDTDAPTRQLYRAKFKSFRNQLRRLGVSNRDLGRIPVSSAQPLHPIFGRRDGHLLFENRLGDFISNEQNLKQAQEALRKFLKETVRVKPLAYYALLHADGDRMGKVIDHQQTETQHRALSRALAQFAGNVKQVVEAHQGSLVYAGGDDVLAFLPVHKVLPCAQKLAADFRDQLHTFEDAEGFSPTLSAGIVIAHHLDPLSDALDLARKAEKAAKSLPGKNALAVTLSKRSGVERTVKGHWCRLDQRLLTFTRWHCQELVPDGAAYELDDLARRLTVEKTHPDYATLQQAIHVEALRIWQRKRAKRGTANVGEDILAQIKTWLESSELRVAELAEELIVARIFADAKELAQPSAQTAVANGGAN